MVAAFLGVYFVASAWNRMTNDGALPEVDATASPQLVVPPPRREQIEIVIWLPPGSRLTLNGQTFLAICSHNARCGCSYQLLLPICPSSN
ncbi:hypothetical protein KBD34_05800 [Patescibacteria group bacterium]|nr:hypothetical protein [Patescibacteria group bacterium]